MARAGQRPSRFAQVRNAIAMLQINLAAVPRLCGVKKTR